MNTRFNYVKPEPRDNSQDDVFYKWTLEKKIRVLNTQKDGSVDNYVEEEIWKKEKCLWSEFIKSYDFGSVQEQVIDHLTKGTPLVTAHTLPSGDYTRLQKGAEIKKEMVEKGITLEMLIDALKSQSSSGNEEVKGDDVNG